MADGNEEKPTQANPRGCFSKLLVMILTVCAVGLGFALYFMAQPQDLSDIHGYTQESRAAVPRDIRSMLQNSLDRSYPVTLTESEINRWLLATLKTKQGGLLADSVSLDGVWVHLEDGRAEVVLERKVLGKPFTVSIYLQIEQSESDSGATTAVQFHGGPFHPYLPFPKCGGRFGRLPVPQGFLHLVMPSFEKLAAAFPDELRLFKDMARIKIEDERLTFDPRLPQQPVSGSPEPAVPSS